ncbi:MAG: GGDEF domain-containing protein [Actinobacteria bacterium]|nr:GGDEF domain-containing protein [Actinomycetota bacterium]
MRRAQVDQLTGAFGRELGMAALEHEIDRVRRADGRLVLAFVDVDKLKDVNDRDGHPAGDALLRDVVGAIRSHLRSYDPIVRVGGDEFICVLAATELDEARRRFDAIRQTIKATQPTASISVGYATLRPQDTLTQLIARGDSALYDDKDDG